VFIFVVLTNVLKHLYFALSNETEPSSAGEQLVRDSLVADEKVKFK
jgi:hypothetical protein